MDCYVVHAIDRRFAVSVALDAGLAGRITYIIYMNSTAPAVDPSLFAAQGAHVCAFVRLFVCLLDDDDDPLAWL